MKKELIKIPYLYGAIGGYLITSALQIPSPPVYVWALAGFITIAFTLVWCIKYKVNDDDYGDFDE